MARCELRSEDDFRQNGYRVMNADNSVSESAKQSGIDKALILMRGRQTFVSYRYKKSGIFSQPAPVQ